MAICGSPAHSWPQCAQKAPMNMGSAPGLITPWMSLEELPHDLAGGYRSAGRTEEREIRAAGPGVPGALDGVDDDCCIAGAIRVACGGCIPNGRKRPGAGGAAISPHQALQPRREGQLHPVLRIGG